jgi:hypothetical protein
MKLFKTGLFLLFFFLSACNPVRSFNFSVIYHPKLVLKADTNTILLINRFDLAKTNIKNPRELAAIRVCAFASINCAAKNLAALHRVKVINLVDSAEMTIDTSSIEFLASLHHADCVLELNNFSADVSLNVGGNNSNDYYVSSVAVSYTLFDDSHVFSKKLQGTGYQTSWSNFSGLLPSLISHPTVRGNERSVEAAAGHATRKALQDYLPHTAAHQRILYDDASLHAAVLELLAGHYDKACDLLKPWLDNKDLKLASRAAYDLAVVYEAQGDVDAAIIMAHQSLDKRKPWNIAGLLIDSLKYK